MKKGVVVWNLGQWKFHYEMIEITCYEPAIIISVARLIPSINDSRHPYKLSNLLFVTESLTFMAGVPNLPSLKILYKLWTPVVVSSVMPRIPGKNCGYFSWTKLVRSPPSSKIMFNGWPSGKTSVWSMHQRYSSSVSPFQANTRTPVAAIAAAAWSCVLKILHDDHWTWNIQQNRKKLDHKIEKKKFNWKYSKNSIYLNYSDAILSIRKKNCVRLSKMITNTFARW